MTAHPAPDTAIQPAASIVMLRDAPAGLEVFLLRRHGDAQVLGGAYVFPGGKVDPEDAQPAALAALGQPLAQLQAQLGEADLGPSEAGAIWRAALREVQEETGVAYADTALLVPWSRWITPASGGLMRRRFDTRFFVAPVPEGQEPRHDERESTEGLWLTPHAALRRWWAGAIEFAPPQVMTLQHVARHAQVAGVLAEARSRRPPRVQPEPWQEGAERGLCYPGDASHSVRERALPGPTRLVLRGGRFEPPRGLADLIAPPR